MALVLVIIGILLLFWECIPSSQEFPASISILHINQVKSRSLFEWGKQFLLAAIQLSNCVNDLILSCICIFNHKFITLFDHFHWSHLPILLLRVQIIHQAKIISIWIELTAFIVYIFQAIPTSFTNTDPKSSIFLIRNHALSNLYPTQIVRSDICKDFWWVFEVFS